MKALMAEATLVSREHQYARQQLQVARRGVIGETRSTDFAAADQLSRAKHYIFGTATLKMTITGGSHTRIAAGCQEAVYRLPPIVKVRRPSSVTFASSQLLAHGGAKLPARDRARFSKYFGQLE